MNVTEQLNVRLHTGEKAALAAAARRSNLSVSSYIRKRLFDSPLSEEDQVLINGLAALKPRFEAALQNINANMQQIAALRQAENSTATACPATHINESDLAAIADHLGLSKESGALK